MQILMSAMAVFAIAHFVQADNPDPVLKQAAERCAQFENDVQDMRIVQEMKTYAPDGIITFEQTVYTKGKKSRVEMTMPIAAMQGGEGEGVLQAIMVNDGVNAWIISPLGERKQLTEEEAKRNEPAGNCWGFFPDNAKVTGSEMAHGRDCYIVELVEEGIRTRLWLDKTNFIPVQGETRDSTGTEQYRWTHSDFHPIAGDWEYPYQTEMYDGDSLAASVTVTSLEVNQGLSEALFNPDSVHVPELDLEELIKLMVEPEDTNGTE